MTTKGLPNTPPNTPPGYLDTGTRAWDWAYSDKERGPFRLLTTDIAETSSKTYAELLSGELMEFVVGRAKRQWSLHRNLLSYHSGWFKKKVKEEVQERGGRIDLFDDDPRAFEMLVKWLYTGKIDDVSAVTLEKKWDYIYACQQLYILCHKMDLPQLQNLAMDQFRRGCFEAGLVPGVEEMIPIYQKLPASSPFRKLVSRIAARQILDPESEKGSAGYRDAFACNPDFAIDVIDAMKEGVGGFLLDDPTEVGGCLFHDHPNGQPCHLTKRNG